MSKNRTVRAKGVLGRDSPQKREMWAGFVRARRKGAAGRPLHRYITLACLQYRRSQENCLDSNTLRRRVSCCLHYPVRNVKFPLKAGLELEVTGKPTEGRWLPSVLGYCLALGLLTSSAPASANGRFPRAEGVVENPGNSSELTLAATYGLLHTDDRGKNWYYVCESEFSGQDKFSGDPLLAAPNESDLFVYAQPTLNVSRDHACTWSSVLGGADASVIDFTVSHGNPNRILALLYSNAADSVFSISESTDNGASFQPLGPALPLASRLTIDVAPSDRNRIYVSGQDTSGNGAVLVSQDHGTSWSTYSLATTDPPYIAGIHPSDPNKLFVRTDVWQYGAVGPNGEIERSANDALYYSSDGGKTWTEVLRQRSKILGFAWSPDGSRVLAGYGDPGGDNGVGTPYVNPQANGLYVSPIDSFVFSKLVSQSVTGLRWTSTGIYACASDSEVGYALGFAGSTDVLGTSGFAPLLRLRDVRGPSPSCSNAQGICSSVWLWTCATFGASCATGGAPTATGGAGGTSLGGASGGASGSTSSGSTSKSAACEISGPSRTSALTSGFFVVFIVVALLGLFFRRRRRRHYRKPGLRIIVMGRPRPP